MEMATVWSSVLSLMTGLLLWGWKGHRDEVVRLQILLNRTREEMAKEYITKQEVHADINRVMDRLESLDAKMDRLIESSKRGSVS